MKVRRDTAGVWVALLLASACGSRAYAPANTELTPATHAKFFDIATGAHANMDCNNCHGTADSFLQYSCTGCHDHDQPSSDAAHFGITASYFFSPTSCYQCHAPGTNLSFDHRAFFPVAPGDVHQLMSCLSCHPNTADRTQTDCLTCHPPNPTDGFHANVGGYVQQNSACLQCHADSQLNPVATHLPFHITAGYKHYLQSCTACHTTARTDKPYGTDFTVYECTNACHPQTQLEPQHLSYPGYTYTTASCVQAGCHPAGTLPGQASRVVAPKRAWALLDLLPRARL